MKAYRAVLAALLAGATLYGPQAAAIPPKEPTKRQVEAEAYDAAKVAYLEGVTRARNNDAVGARDQMKRLLSLPGFQFLSASEQYLTYTLLGAFALDLGDDEDAKAAILKATAMPQASGSDWHNRLRVAYRLGDTVDAADSLTVIAERWPNTLDQLNDDGILWIFRAARKRTDGSDQSFKLMSALKAADWKFTDPYSDASFIWVELALDLLEKGRLEDAERVASGITDPYSIVRMQADRRFDAITQKSPARFSPEAAADRKIDKQRSLLAANPDSLPAVNALAAVLMDRGKTAEGLAVLDQALDRIAAAKDGEAPFSDLDEVNWTFNQRSTALRRLGRFDEAIEVMRAGARRPEKGGMNVSQTLNLAEALAWRGKPVDALEALKGAEFAKPSDYGKMVIRRVQVCAYAQLGDAARQNEALDYMRKNVKTSYTLTIIAELCAGNISKAVDLYVLQLKDPLLADKVLVDLQTYIEVAPSSKFAKLVDDRDKAAITDPQVQAALNAIGRVNRYALMPQ